MNTTKLCLYREAIKSDTNDQRSTQSNIICVRPGTAQSTSTLRCEPGREVTTKQRGGFLAFSKHRTALLRSSMATSASTGSRGAKTSDQVRSKTAASLALPCPSDVVRACVAGTKYSVGKPKVHVAIVFSELCVVHPVTVTS